MSREEQGIKILLLLVIVLFFIVLFARSQDFRSFRMQLLERQAKAQVTDRAKKEIEAIERQRQRNTQTLATLVAINQISAQLFKQKENPFLVKVDEKEQLEKLERYVKKLKRLMD